MPAPGPGGRSNAQKIPSTAGHATRNGTTQNVGRVLDRRGYSLTVVPMEKNQ